MTRAGARTPSASTQARGDSVNVVNASFKGELDAGRRAARIEIPLWERPLVRDIAKLLAGLIVLLVLVLRVLRPLMRGLLSAARAACAVRARRRSPGGAPGAVGRPAGQRRPLDYERTGRAGARAW